jgi:hypothetical protein
MRVLLALVLLLFLVLLYAHCVPGTIPFIPWNHHG